MADYLAMNFVIQQFAGQLPLRVSITFRICPTHFTACLELSPNNKASKARDSPLKDLHRHFQLNLSHWSCLLVEVYMYDKKYV
jgi:hypothetical protein